MEVIAQFFTSVDIWAIIIKVLLTAALGALATWLGTLIANLIAKNKNSKIYKYAETLVDAAEQKFPNEGVKMGPQKLDYVMSQLVIKFPKIKDSQYFYNIVEQAVFKLNEKRNADKAALEFYKKFGEWPKDFIPSEELKLEAGIVEDSDNTEVDENTTENTNSESISNSKDTAENKEEQPVIEKDPIDAGLSAQSKSTTPVTTKNDVKKSLSSF